MNKKLTIDIDKNILNKIDSSKKIDKKFISNALNHYINNSKSIQNVSTMKRDIELLKDKNSSLEKERELLQIDNICLKQRIHELESRIDDLVEKYPSASILLGKTPEINETSIFTTIKKKIL